MGIIPIEKTTQKIGSVQTESQIGVIRNYVQRQLNLDHVKLSARGMILTDDQQTLTRYEYGHHFHCGTVIDDGRTGTVYFA